MLSLSKHLVLLAGPSDGNGRDPSTARRGGYLSRRFAVHIAVSLVRRFVQDDVIGHGTTAPANVMLSLSKHLVLLAELGLETGEILQLRAAPVSLRDSPL